MNSLQESYIKALNPTVTVKITNLDKGTVPLGILHIIQLGLTKSKFKLFTDEENGVIYIGKKV